MVINKYILKENYYEMHIIKTDGEEAVCLIDEEDYDFCKNINWTFRRRGNHYCVKATTRPYANIHLHRILLRENISPNVVVDHINRNALDNRKNNLRAASYSINSSNAKPRIESNSGIRGVYKRKARPGVAKESWICEWSIEGKRFSKSFSIEKYGEDEAFERAYNLRKEKEKELKI